MKYLSGRSLGYLLPALSGALLGISVLPTDRIPLAHWAVFFGFVPLWNWWLGRPHGREIFVGGWLAQFVLTLIAFNWLAYTMHEYAVLSWPVAALALLAFAGVANLYVPLAGILAGLLFPAGVGEGYRIAGFFLLTSIGERVFPMLFPWNLGYVWFYQRWPGFQFADVIGFQGLSTASLAVNALVLWAWRRKISDQGWWPPLVAASGLLLLLNGAGAFRAALVARPDRAFHALFVQANIGNKQKIEAEFGDQARARIVTRYVELTEHGLSENRDAPAPDLVIWPENAYPYLILDPSLSRPEERPLRDLATGHEIPIVTGGYGFDGTDAINNTVFLISPQGIWAGPPYRKTVLLPFGEYIPGASWIPALKTLFPRVRDYRAGGGAQVNTLGELKLGIEICYEGLFDWFARDLARLGAGVIVNVTNDSWYGRWQQPYQHFFMTLGRAVETRLPLLRVTNTGISGVALADGTLLDSSPVGEEWVHLFRVPYVASPDPTPFVRYGYWLMPALLGFGLAVAVVASRVRSRWKLSGG